MTVDRARGELAELHDNAGRGPKDDQRSDEPILEEVSDRLIDDRRVDASDLSVHVHRGCVTLTGTVTSREQKRRAEEVADRISGVKEVTNNIRVSCDDENHENQPSPSNGRARPHPASAL